MFWGVIAPSDPPDPSRAGPDSGRSTSPRPAASAAPSCCTSRSRGRASSGYDTRDPEKSSDLLRSGPHVPPGPVRSGLLPFLDWCVSVWTSPTSLMSFIPQECRRGNERREAATGAHTEESLPTNTHIASNPTGVGQLKEKVHTSSHLIRRKWRLLWKLFKN